MSFRLSAYISKDPVMCVIGDFMKICPKISNFINIEQIFRIIYKKSYESFIIAADIISQ
jgi:hypothetical protein